MWTANKPGSPVLFPIADCSEQVLGVLAMLIGNGVVVMDDVKRCCAGTHRSFTQSGLLQEEKTFPLSVAIQGMGEGNCSELAFMAHNIVLRMQRTGLGGLCDTGLYRWSILGAIAEDGIKGLTFRFVKDERLSFPNPVGFDGLYKALCPPHYGDMHEAVRELVRRKFGNGGTHESAVPGP